MSDETWLDITSRIVTGVPVELDGLLFGDAQRGDDPGGDLQRELPENWLPPSVSNWTLTEPDRVCLGVLVNQPLDNHVEIATRLVAMAVERGIMPVILSTFAPSGFERFGFRIERLPAGDSVQQNACVEELKRFWDMAIVVDASDILKMR